MRRTRLTNFFGGLLSVAGLIFVFTKLHGFAAQADFSKLSLSSIFALLSLSVLYAFSGILLALSWRALLAHYRVSVSRRWAIRTYGRTQIIKYLPGNVFHLLGRQALGMADKLPARALGKSMGWELVCLASAAISFSPLLLGLKPGCFFLSVILFISSAGGLVLIWKKLKGREFARSAIYCLLFFLTFGLLNLILLETFCAGFKPTNGSLLALAATPVVAWLAGFIVPGAPAGTGVRELVLYSLLSGFVAPSELAVFLILQRVLSICGDLGFFVGARFCPQGDTRLVPREST